MIYGVMVSEDFDGSSLIPIEISAIPSRIIDKQFCMKELHGRGKNRTWYKTVWSKLYRRDIICDMGFRNTSSEDTEFNNRVYLRMKKAILLEKGLYYWVQHPSSTTHTSFNDRNIDIINSYVMCMNEIPKSEVLCRNQCLSALYRTILVTRFSSNNTPYKHKTYQYAKLVHQQFKEEFFRSRTDWMRKQGILLLYCFPGLTTAIMYFLDWLVRIKSKMFII